MQRYIKSGSVLHVLLYNIYFRHGNKHYVYNTLTTSLVAIDEYSFIQLKNGDINCIEPNVMRHLLEQRFVVDKSLNELSVYECYYNEAQYGAHNDEFRLVLIPTYNCNLKCTYCFEDCANNTMISKEDIQQVIRFVICHVSKVKSYKKISLILFGGEPLLCWQACVTLCDSLRVFSESKGIHFSTKIITNALLITPRIINELFIPNEMRIQITMDGNRSIHDKRRVYRNGKGTYSEIIEAIELLNHFNLTDNIDLRINVDKNNISSIEEVLADIHGKVGYIYVGLLRAIGNNKERVSDCISDNDYILKYRPYLEPLFNKYGKTLHYVAFGKKHTCALNSDNSYIVDNNLDVYKCDNLVGKKQYAVGKIQDNSFVKAPEYYMQRSWSPLHFENCRKCNRLPACSASCAYLCLTNNGSMNIPLCSMTEQELVEKVIQFIDKY